MEPSKVFLSSRMAVGRLQTLRRELHRRRELGTTGIWVPELADPKMTGLPLDEAEVACLRQVRECQGFACVLDGSYGKDDWDITDISILEVEIFVAALSRIPIRVFLLEPFDPDPRIATLLEIVEAAWPGAVDTTPKSRDGVSEAVLRFCDELTLPHRWLFRRLVEVFARRRSPAFQRGRLDVLFLEGRAAPPPRGRLDSLLITQLVERAEAQAGAPEKLVDLWKAVRCLASAPYRDPRFQNWLPLWDRVLTHWASASSWYGLHGHLFLSRLAAVNALIEIRHRGSTDSGLDADLAIQGTQGAVASEYYSIAKRVSSWRARRRLLLQALDRVNFALEQGQHEITGLLSIRGSIHLALGAPGSAVCDYERALRLRRELGKGVGETEVELGLGYLFLGRLRAAEELLESGVAHLRGGEPSGFVVRALRKLSLFYLMTLRWEKSRDALSEAYQIADKLGLQDQIDQIKRMPGGRALGGGTQQT